MKEHSKSFKFIFEIHYSHIYTTRKCDMIHYFICPPANFWISVKKSNECEGNNVYHDRCEILVKFLKVQQFNKNICNRLDYQWVNENDFGKCTMPDRHVELYIQLSFDYNPFLSKTLQDFT